ncbi:uncharacterized protein LOC134475808 [Cavia porcellus]|uniref:uncharacterized protein LOC134475808 n=1 Tax=Cavia porcellus TaxID=10141 RepID=UPI000661C9BA
MLLHFFVLKLCTKPCGPCSGHHPPHFLPAKAATQKSEDLGRLGRGEGSPPTDEDPTVPQFPTYRAEAAPSRRGLGLRSGLCHSLSLSHAPLPPPPLSSLRNPGETSCPAFQGQPHLPQASRRCPLLLAHFLPLSVGGPISVGELIPPPKRTLQPERLCPSRRLAFVLAVPAHLTSSRFLTRSVRHSHSCPVHAAHSTLMPAPETVPVTLSLALALASPVSDRLTLGLDCSLQGPAGFQSLQLSRHKIHRALPTHLSACCCRRLAPHCSLSTPLSPRCHQSLHTAMRHLSLETGGGPLCTDTVHCLSSPLPLGAVTHETRRVGTQICPRQKDLPCTFKGS